MSYWIMFCSLLCMANSLLSQEKNYHNLANFGHASSTVDIAHFSSDQFILTGIHLPPSILTLPNNQYRAFLLQIDENLHPVWANQYVTDIEINNQTYNISLRSSEVHETSDGGLIVAGNIGDFAPAPALPISDYSFLMKTNSSGQVLWFQVYYSNGWLYSVTETPDGGFIAVGDREIDGPTGTYFNTATIIRTNSIGDVLWSRSILTPNSNAEASAALKKVVSYNRPNTGGGVYEYAAIGYGRSVESMCTNSTGHTYNSPSESEVLLTVITEDVTNLSPSFDCRLFGTQQAQTGAYSPIEVGVSLTTQGEDIYFVGGYTDSHCSHPNGHTPRKLLLSKFNPNNTVAGGIAYAYTYDFNGHSIDPTDIGLLTTPNGASQLAISGHVNEESFIFKADIAGSYQELLMVNSAPTISPTANHTGTAIIQASTGEAILAGNVEYDSFYRLQYLVKENPLRNEDCLDYLHQPIQATVVLPLLSANANTEAFQGHLVGVSALPITVNDTILCESDTNACPPPTAMDDTLEICFDPSLPASIWIDVLANDVFSAPTEIGFITQPTRGTAIIQQNNQIAFSPNGSGTVSFQYYIKVIGCGSDTGTVYIHINESPTVSFSTYPNPTGGINFQDLSSGNPTTWQWEFGDGAGSSIQNPHHTYANPGGYVACLTAGNSCGQDIRCKRVQVRNPCTAPVAQDDSLLICAMSNTTAGVINVLANDMVTQPAQVTILGRPNHGTLQNTHNATNYIGYTPDAGFTGIDSLSYIVCDLCGCDTATLYFFVLPEPIPSFTYTSTGASVSFTNASMYWTEIHWDFGDGNTSTQPNPQHTYTAPGSYLVCIEVINPCDTSEYCTIINSGRNCNAPTTVNDTLLFCTANPPSAPNLDLLANDTYASTPTVSIISGPSNGFILPDVAPGAYNYTPYGPGLDSLTYEVCDSCGCSLGKAYIYTQLPPVAFFANTTGGPTISFQNSSVNATDWHWDFGDGNTSSLPEPTHTYATHGTYTVCLIAENMACGSDTFCQTIMVQDTCTGPPITGLDHIILCIDPTTNRQSVTFDILANDTINSNSFVVSVPTSTNNGSLYQSSTNPGLITYSPTNATPGAALAVFYQLTNQCGTDIGIIYIEINQAPDEDFIFSTAPSSSLSKTFSVVSNNNVATDTRIWDFGDGNSVQINGNPTTTTHVYAAPGLYTVCLTSINSCDSVTVCHDVYVGISCATPDARNDSISVCTRTLFNQLDLFANDFYNSNQQLTILSGPHNGNISNVSNNGTVVYQPNFNFIGVDSIQYQLCDSCGCDIATAYIFVQSMPSVQFSTTSNGWTVNFTANTQVAGTTWLWDFGDNTGAQSYSANTSHVYTRPGEYTVCLTVITACGTVTDCQTVTVCGRDIYEDNDNFTTAAQIDDRRTLRAVICPSGDIDWYSLYVGPSRPHLRVNLFSLPENYDLSVYDNAGSLLGTSTMGGTNAEEIRLNGLMPGYYYIKVEGVAGAYDPTDSYRLRARTRTAPFNRTVQDNIEEGKEFNEEELTETNTPTFSEPHLTNYPNPFSDITYFEYSLPEDATISLSIYNVMGQELEVLIDSEEASAGIHQQTFDARHLPDGVYYCILTIDSQQITQKILLAR